MVRRLALIVGCCTVAAACSGGEDDKSENPITIPDDLGPGAVAELGATFTVQGTSADGLSRPRDLAFHPTRNELWTVNQDTDGTVIYFNPGMVTQSAQNIVDPFAVHFMEEVSTIAFGQTGTFGTCQESRNTYDDQFPANDFMGPVLWSDDLEIYAQPFTELGSHLDMLHESPNCMGIAHDTANVYWVFDGHNGHAVRYDFAQDHGPGQDDHADGIVRRYPDVELTRMAGVIGDMVLDHATGILYIADTGTGRILWMDTTTGSEDEDLIDEFEDAPEPLEEYSAYDGVKHGVLADGLTAPAGLHLDGARLFVSENGTGSIAVLDLEEKEALGRLQTDAQSIMGLAIGDDGKIWYVDATANELIRVDP